MVNSHFIVAVPILREFNGFVTPGGLGRRVAFRAKIDWSECTLVEVKTRLQSGAPVLRGTRTPVNVIVDNSTTA
jgi:hypothetical protein